MKNSLYLIFTLFIYVLLAFPVSHPAFAGEKALTEINIVTGRESGTYYKIGKDLQKLSSRHGIDLNVIPSVGSVENVVKVFEFPSIKLGITQMDTMTFQSIQPLVNGNAALAELKNIIDNLQLVLPLFHEEIHLLANKNIKQISDLNGKKVAIGSRTSGTHGTALSILRMYKVRPARIKPLDAARAIESLRKGTVDALFYVVGAPAALFEKDIKLSDKFHLVPIIVGDIDNTQVLKSLYKKTIIPAKTYSWQKEEVQTLSVGNILITADTGQCEDVGKFAKMIYDNLDWLKENGHPKWKNVNLDLSKILENRSVSPCVTRELKTAK